MSVEERKHSHSQCHTWISSTYEFTDTYKTLCMTERGGLHFQIKIKTPRFKCPTQGAINSKIVGHGHIDDKVLFDCVKIL